MYIRIGLIASLCILLLQSNAYAEGNSFELVDVYATRPGETAPMGRFESGETIDFFFLFNLDTDQTQTARFTFDIYEQFNNPVASGNIDEAIHPGMTSFRYAHTLGSNFRTTTYHVYASMAVGSEKRESEFDIVVESSGIQPGVLIEDVRLEPRAADFELEQLAEAAIPYTLSVDFNMEYILDYNYAEIRWIGLTSQEFILDEGIGTLWTNDGLNSFTADSYIARPPAGSVQEAVFSVEVTVMGYTDSVTFPIDTLPVSWSEIQSGEATGEQTNFYVGEAYLVTSDGARASVFQQGEEIRARILTSGIIPVGTRVIMQAEDRLDGSTHDFYFDLPEGADLPVTEVSLPDEFDLTPGTYTFYWTVVMPDGIFAERMTYFTISAIQGVVIPSEIELPGGVKFTVPLSWQVLEESKDDTYASMVTPDGIMCEIGGAPMEEPFNVAFIAAIYECNYEASKIPPDAVLLTSDETSLEGTMEYVRHAWLGDGKIFVNSYWLYRMEEGMYQFLLVTCKGTEEQVEETYSANDIIELNIEFNY